MDNFDLSQLQNLLKRPKKSRNLKCLKKIQSFLKSIPFFADLGKDLPVNEVIECFRCVQSMNYTGDDIIRNQGDTVEHIYIVLQGRVVFENAQDEIFKDFEPGLVFGEDLLDTGMIDFSIRSYSSTTVLAYYSKDDYRKCLSKHREEKKIALVNFLSVQKQFTKWPKGLLIFLSSCLTEKKLEKGEILFSRLESPDKVLILYEGELMLIGKNVQRLRSGEMLGFEELRTSGKYSNTCMVTQRSTVLVLCKFDFLRILPQLQPSQRGYLKSASRSRKIFNDMAEAKPFFSPQKVIRSNFSKGTRLSMDNIRAIIPMKSIHHSNTLLKKRVAKSTSSLNRLYN